MIKCLKIAYSHDNKQHIKDWRTVMSGVFNYTTPSECNIDYHNLINFAKRLEAQDIPMHSLTIMRGSKICMETYYAPYDKDTFHRMFSMTKTLVSLGIGKLYGEGKLSLDDHIVDYFKDKLPEAGAYEYTAMLTIRDMLTMRTCHDKTTYKAAGVTDWVGSFFTVKPVHAPGTQFAYDTSSTHVLGALIERLSGMKLIEYLRKSFLDEMGCSKDAFIIEDPYGVPMGGSGLCARPSDMLKVIYLISKDGVWNGKQLIPADYIREARTKQSDPYGKSGTLEEMQGYGYQIWMTRNGGYALYGMAGQLAVYVPDKDIYMVTTADTLGRQGGVQCIYDAFWEEIYNKIDDKTQVASETKEALKEYDEFLHSRKIFALSTDITSSYENVINDVTYICDDNECGMENVNIKIVDGDINSVGDNHLGCGDYAKDNSVVDSRLGSDDYAKDNSVSNSHLGSDDYAKDNFVEDNASGNNSDSDNIGKCTPSKNKSGKYGILTYTNATGTHSISFGFGYNIESVFPIYNFRCVASGAWKTDNNLLIKIQIIDSAVGNLYISLSYKDKYATVFLKKLEETYFNEFNGVFGASQIK